MAQRSLNALTRLWPLRRTNKKPDQLSVELAPAPEAEPLALAGPAPAAVLPVAAEPLVAEVAPEADQAPKESCPPGFRESLGTCCADQPVAGPALDSGKTAPLEEAPTSKADEPDRGLRRPKPATAPQMEYLRGLLREITAVHVFPAGEDWSGMLLDFQETVLAVAAESKRGASTLIDVSLRVKGRRRALESICTAAGQRFDTIVYKHFPAKRPPIRGVPGQLAPASPIQAETIRRFILDRANKSLRKYVDNYEKDDWD